MIGSVHTPPARLVALLLIITLFLAACGAAPTATTEQPADPTTAADASGDAPTPIPPTATPGVVSVPIEGKTNVTWWTHDNTAFVAANKEMMRRFEEKNPDIHIVYQYFPYDVFINKLQTSYASNTEPDVQQMFGTWVTDYARKGLLAELTTPKAQLEDQFWPAALGAYEWEGKAYGIPHEYNIENGGLFVNVKMFEEAGLEYPTSWDEIIAAGKKMAKWNGDMIDRAGFAYTHSDSITFLYLSFILQQNASYWADDGIHVDFNTPEGKKAWEFLTGLETTEKLTQAKAFPNLNTFEVFFPGKAAMGHVGPWVIGVAAESFPDFKYKTDWDYIPIPSFTTGTPALFAAESGWGEVISSRSKNMDAAMKFLQFMSEPDNSRDWNAMTATVPALKALKDDPKILEDIPAIKTSFDALANGQWVGPVQNRDRFWTIMQDHYTAVVLGSEQATDSPALITQEINAMIDEYIGP